MMMPNEESSRMSIDNFGSSRLLHDIEEISKALYLPDPTPKPSPAKYVKDDLLLNEKKSSIWKWKPLKALTHNRNHRLSCSFFLHIHSIEGLPLNFNDLNLCVYWKRKHEVLKSQCVRVKEGVAEFEETLIHSCLVYVSKHDPHDDVAKYTPKLSLLYASVVGAPSLDIGKHWIDLTRLLPLSLTELEDEKNRYGKWITSFKLTGPSIGLLYELLDDDAKPSYSKELCSISNEVYADEFTVIDKGIEYPKSVESPCIETINVADLFDDDTETETAFDDINYKENDTFYPEESNEEEVELFLQNVSVSEKFGLDLKFHEDQFLENDYCGGGKMPESPRERLLQQFEKEAGNFVFDLDGNEDQNDCCNISGSSFLFQKAEMEHDYQAGPSLISRRKARMLENLETETLMKKWGLNERAFQNSPRTDSGAFGSPFYLSPETMHELPSWRWLVGQVSSTAVLPPAMGSNGMDILVKWATLGPEKMLSQVTRLMPLEVITGKTFQQAAWKAESQFALIERLVSLLKLPFSIMKLETPDLARESIL
ncbi:hypothetical protein L1987_54620 [Smallanthus sonchifolius]|uniref:Uncharacterized protein n=1 Tax=Smallanthus sonchifolius TaxID=185202 RepID=A0ACB9E798_9ASTR|nr:hypothetical protein L1987_54620 [Smallanthus sonchifolius]